MVNKLSSKLSKLLKKNISFSSLYLYVYFIQDLVVLVLPILKLWKMQNLIVMILIFKTIHSSHPFRLDGKNALILVMCVFSTSV